MLLPALDSPPPPAPANPQEPALVSDAYQPNLTRLPPRDSAHPKQRRKCYVSQGEEQHEHHQRVSLIQQAPDGYSDGHTVTRRQQSPVDSLGHGPYAKQSVDGEQSPGVLDVGEQQQVVGYQNQQEYQPQPQLHWHQNGTQQPNTPVSQLPQPVYQHSPTYDAPSYAHPHACMSTWSSSTYANPLHPAHPPWESTQSQEYNYYSSGPTAYARHMQTQAPQQPSCISPTHTTGPYQAQTLAGPSSNTFRFIPRLTLPFNGDDTTRRPSGSSAASDVFHSSLTHEPTTPWDDDRMASSQPEWWMSYMGVSNNSHHSEEPMNPLQSSTVDPGDHLFSAGLTQSSPVGLALADGPSSHSPRLPAQADLSSILPTNPGAARAGPGVNININASSPNGESNRRFGPDRSDRTHTRRDSGPYHRPISPVTRKTRPVKYEGNIGRLQERCRRQRADENAIMLLGKIFANGVGLAALTRPLTDAEVESGELGIVAGKVYTSFLRPTNGEDGGVPRYVCRLCYGDKTWKHAKDVLRHIRRDHVGLPEACEECHRNFYTKGEKTRHLCK